MLQKGLSKLSHNNKRERFSYMTRAMAICHLSYVLSIYVDICIKATVKNGWQTASLTMHLIKIQLLAEIQG